jgi:hypothetical protein
MRMAFLCAPRRKYEQQGTPGILAVSWRRRCFLVRGKPICGPASHADIMQRAVGAVIMILGILTVRNRIVHVA